MQLPGRDTALCMANEHVRPVDTRWNIPMHPDAYVGHTTEKVLSRPSTAAGMTRGYGGPRPGRCVPGEGKAGDFSPTAWRRQEQYSTMDNAEIQRFFYRDMPRVTEVNIGETPVAQQAEMWTSTLRGNERGMRDRTRHVSDPFVSKRGQDMMLRLRAAEEAQALYQHRLQMRHAATQRAALASAVANNDIEKTHPTDEEGGHALSDAEKVQLQAIMRRQQARKSQPSSASRVSRPFYDPHHTHVASANEWPTRASSHAYSRPMENL